LGDQVRAAAVYDPIHHTVYSGYLPGPKDCPENDSLATAWEIATGNTTNLTEKAETSIRKELRKEAIALHFTRSSTEKLHEILAVPENQEENQNKCFLENLANRCGSIYALNSGLMAMTEVAAGGMGAFINNITNSWDVAAGEVLIKACGGRVTDFDGNPITYSKEKISVVSAKEHLHQEILDIIKQSMK
jgi:fructose-1,6-bisphosphatase/inositol monophosphatase family enzyme